MGIIDFLLKNGADPHVRVTEGKTIKNNTILHSAISNMISTVNGVGFICKDGDSATTKKCYKEPIKFMKKSSKALLELLLQYNVDPNLQNEKGVSPLHLLVDVADENLVRVLLENKADPNLKTNEGETALHLAIKNESKAIEKLLLEFGADPTT